MQYAYSRSLVRGLSGTLVSPPGKGRWSLLERLFVSYPVLFRVVQRVYHLRYQLVRFSDVEHGSSVLVSAAVVRGGEHSEQLTSSEPFEAVHDALVGSQDVLCLVVVEELLDAVRSKLHDISGTIGISDEVGLDAELGKLNNIRIPNILKFGF